MSDQPKIKILICDDHPIMRFGIAAIIQSQPNMVVAGQAGTAEEALRLFWEHSARHYSDGSQASG